MSEEMNLARFFAPLRKSEDEQRIVVGIASTEGPDQQPGIWKGKHYDADIVDPGALEAALGDYMQWRNLREMHQNSAVGTTLKAEMMNGELHIEARVIDDTAWEKVKAGVYKGFSIGGRVLDAVIEKLPDGRTVRRILKLMLTEISLVDRPANPGAKIFVFKGEINMGHGDQDGQERDFVAEAITALQQQRNVFERDGDLDGAAFCTQTIALMAGTTDDRETAVHRAILGLVNMLPATDEMAKAIRTSYDDGQDANDDDGADVTTAFTRALAPLAEVMKSIDSRLKAIEEAPADGGPVLRPVGKSMRGRQQGDEGEGELEKLAKAIQETTDPLQAAALREQLAVAQIRSMYDGGVR